MVKDKKGRASRTRSLMDMVLESIAPPIIEGAGKVIRSLGEGAIEDRLMRIHGKMMRKTLSLVLVLFGAVFLVLALFFFLRDFLGWSNSAGLSFIGVLVIAAGLLLGAWKSRG